MPEPIEERFLANLGRVRGLVALYDRFAGPSPGRPSVAESDLLRAAVVQLHASLEDLLRELAARRLPGAPPTTLQQIPLPGGVKRKKRFTLADLSLFRGLSVDEVIDKSVEIYLERATFGNLNRVASLLRSVGLALPRGKELKAEIAAMMARRHQIGHRLDRNQFRGRGHHRASSISKKIVEGWLEAVERFGVDLLGQP